MLTRKQLSLIHVAKKQTGLKEPEYRDLLLGFGVPSSKDLRPTDFDALMRQFKALGFVSTSRFKKPLESKKRLMSKILAIKADMNLSDAYIAGMVRKMFKNNDGEPLEFYNWLDADQMRRLVAALTYHQKRKASARKPALNRQEVH